MDRRNELLTNCLIEVETQCKMGPTVRLLDIIFNFKKGLKRQTSIKMLEIIFGKVSIECSKLFEQPLKFSKFSLK